jgi:hypothetical protein
MAVENPNAFKLWINGNVVHKYFSQIDLPAKEIKKIELALEHFELRARVQMIASELHRTLPQPYPKALKKLMAIVRKSQMKSFELWIPSSKDFEILKRHSFKPITTRKFYPGEHGIAIKLNGAESKAKSFILAR